jgi:hypothetical protein
MARPEIARHGRTFFAWKEGFLVGTYQTFDKAMKALREVEYPDTPLDRRGYS